MQLNVDGNNPKVRPPEILQQGRVLVCVCMPSLPTAIIHLDLEDSFGLETWMINGKERDAAEGIFSMKG